MKKLILLAFVLFACANQQVHDGGCPERYTPDCMIVADQAGAGWFCVEQAMEWGLVDVME